MVERAVELASKVWEVSAEYELRFEVCDKTLTIMLREGTAEVFGTELVQNKEVLLYAGAKVALYTWHGCKVQVYGEPENCYLAKETPMRRYLNVHMALEQQRQSAKANDTLGPRVMVVGLTDVGKSTLCRILLNYAARLGHQTMFVDLDVGQTSIGIPGSIGVLPVERPADITTGFSLQAPVVFHFGHKTPEGNNKLYRTIIDSAADMVERRCQALPDAKHGGVVINTCGWVTGEGYRHIRHAAAAFRVDAIIILDNDLLFNKLQRDGPMFPDACKFVALPKSGGVVVRNRAVRANSRDTQIRRYFYGVARELYPHTFTVLFDSVKIFKIGAPAVPESCLPLGMKQDDVETKLMPVKPSSDLMHCILAVSFASTAEENLVKSNVAGFICVCDVSMERRSMRVLSPQQEPLPLSILLLSEVRFMDNS